MSATTRIASLAAGLPANPSVFDRVFPYQCEVRIQSSKTANEMILSLGYESYHVFKEKKAGIATYEFFVSTMDGSGAYRYMNLDLRLNYYVLGFRQEGDAKPTIRSLKAAGFKVYPLQRVYGR